MKLKITRTYIMNEQQLNSIQRNSVIHSKVLQADGTYLVNFTRYNMNSYNNIANSLIREKYSQSEEFAILRKAINNANNQEYVEYFAFVEVCKEKAKAYISERVSLFGR